MKSNTNRKVSFRGSEDFLEIEIKEPVTHAAGYLGVREALKHTFKEMGVLRSMRTLLSMNQKDGFDCPSCAWPDPEHPSQLQVILVQIFFKKTRLKNYLN